MRPTLAVATLGLLLGAASPVRAPQSARYPDVYHGALPMCGPLGLAGTADRFVVRFVDAVGHCNFTTAQIGNAFDDLRAWARDGKKPQAGEQK